MIGYTSLPGIVKFFSGTEAKWNANTLIIPENIIIFTTDTHIMKIGDGTKTFAELDVWINFDEMPLTEDGNNTPSILENDIGAGDVGKIVILGSNLAFTPSSTDLANVIQRISDAISKNNSQTDTITNDLSPKADLIDLFTEEDENKLCIIKNGKYSASNYTLEELNTIIENIANEKLGLIISSISFYSDELCKHEVFTLTENSTYYAKVLASNESGLPIQYNLKSDNSNITISPEFPTVNSTGIFEITIGNIDTEVLTEFTTNVNNAVTTKSLSTSIYIKSNYIDFRIVGEAGSITSIAGEFLDNTNGIVQDNNGNYFALMNDGANILLKLNKSFNVLSIKNPQSLNKAEFGSMVIDTDNNIILSGIDITDSGNNKNPVLYKLSNDLNAIIDSIFLTETPNDWIIIDMILNNKGNVVCVGKSNGVGFIYEFSTNPFTLINHKYLNSGITEFNKIVINKADNSYFILGKSSGYETIIHFNNDFNILHQYKYYSSDDDLSKVKLKGITVDPLKGLVYVVGYDETGSPVSGKSPVSLLLTLNANTMEIVNMQLFADTANANNEIIFNDITINSNGNLVIIGESIDSASGSDYGTLTVLDGNDTSVVIGCYKIGEGSYMSGNKIIVNSNDDFICLFNTTEWNDNKVALTMISKVLPPNGIYTAIVKTTLRYENIPFNYIESSNLITDSIIMSESTGIVVTQINNLSDKIYDRNAINVEIDSIPSS